MRTVGIATLVEREGSFKKCIESLYPQVDKIYAVLNNYKSIPGWLRQMPKVNYSLANNELGANAKFLSVGLCEGYYFAVDDDMEYPKGYIDYMVSKVDEYHCLIYLGGKRFDNRPIKTFLKGWTFRTKWNQGYEEDFEVDIGLDYGLAFNTDDFKLSINDFHHRNSDDLEVSREAHRQGVKIMVVKHPANYLIYNEAPGYTAYKELYKDDSLATELVNSFLK